VYANQGFRLGRAYGFQFHFETDMDILNRWLSQSADYMAPTGVTPEQVRHGVPLHLETMRHSGQALVNAFVDLFA